MAAIGPQVTRRRRAPWFVAPLAVVVLCTIAYMAVLPYIPSDEPAVQPSPDRPALVAGGIRHAAPAVVADGRLLLPVEALHDLVDPHIVWDETARAVIVTTRDRVVKMRTGDLTAYVNGRPVSLSIAPVMMDDRPYAPAEPFSRLLGLSVHHDPESHVVVIDPPGSQSATGETTVDTAIRTSPSVKAPVISELKQGSEVYLFGEMHGWYLARQKSGLPGYVAKAAVVLKGVTHAPQPPAPDYYRPWKRTGERINLTWEHVLNKNPAPSSIGPLPGVNVVAPTWLKVADGSGSVTCRADPAYVKWAHSRGCEVWALVDNGFDPNRTRAFLSDPAARENIVRSLLLYAEMYDFDGINVDFENVFKEDAGLLVQFIRELVPLAHEQGLAVSIDVTVKSSSGNWSLCYDRKALGSAADYLMLMAYDEYPAGSQTPGPTASLPWVEKGIRSLLEDVPPSKVVLGVPFYTRLWKQPGPAAAPGRLAPDATPAAPGASNGEAARVTQRAVSMDEAAAIIRDRQLQPSWDAEAQQFVVRYEENGHRYVMWIEDEQSIRRRVALVKKFGLKGVASWRRGFENAATWDALAELRLF
ncbi:MAG: glycosyl hydrolase [Firmicutes bacterium]|nr:glycosyl hydrolase [Bacillota bacterium]